MILITPFIEHHPSLPHVWLLKIVFPENSGCGSFTVPLHPTQEVLDTWTLLPNIAMYGNPEKGYISQALPYSAELDPSTALSTYFGKPVHLLYRGRPRAVGLTGKYPELKGMKGYQALCPLLVLSEEGMADVENEARHRIGMQGIGEVWREGKVSVER